MSPDDVQGASAPQADASSVPDSSGEASRPGTQPGGAPAAASTEDPYGYPHDGYPYEESSDYSAPVSSAPVAVVPAPAPAPPTRTSGSGGSGGGGVTRGGSGGGSTPPPDPPSDDEEDGMLRMSFLEHLEELRNRIIRALIGVGVAFVISLTFCNELWRIVSAPAVDALRTLGINPPNLAMITPMESFNVIWVKLPILCSIFIASPWILYQVWAFIAPGLYKKERRWAVPFVLTSAGLFITGGLFAYFIAFRYGLTFLLSIGRGNYVTPIVSITEYFDLFVNVILGVGLVFELPVLIFFLTLLRILSPRFLLNNSRYAILVIFIIAAIVTPTPDVFNLMLFATPMCMLFFVGTFASYLLVLHREQRKFPWKIFCYILGSVTAVAAGALYIAVTKFGYHFVQHWPFLVK